MRNYVYTAKNDQVVAILMKTGLNNVVRPTLFTVVNNIVTPDSGSRILFNVVDKCEQRGPHNIVQSLNSRLIIFTRVPWQWKPLPEKP